MHRWEWERLIKFCVVKKKKSQSLNYRKIQLCRETVRSYQSVLISITEIRLFLLKHYAEKLIKLCYIALLYCGKHSHVATQIWGISDSSGHLLFFFVFLLLREFILVTFFLSLRFLFCQFFSNMHIITVTSISRRRVT